MVNAPSLQSRKLRLRDAKGLVSDFSGSKLQRTGSLTLQPRCGPMGPLLSTGWTVS